MDPFLMDKRFHRYVKVWQRRFAEKETESQILALRAREEVDRAVRILRDYGAKRILLFGSLLRPDRFVPGSDIDLAVEGIPLKDFDRAAADCMMALEFPVDVKPIESLESFFLKTVLEKGEVLYEEERGHSGTHC